MRRLFLLAVFCCFAGTAWAGGPVTRIYAFGDSYSDMGRGYLNTNGLPAIAVFAHRLGLEMVASNAPDSKGRSLDFAVSAASTGASPGESVNGAWLGLGMKDQVQEFRGLVQSGATNFDPKTTVFFLAGGLNDYELSVDEVIGNLEQEIAELYALGGRHFLVGILPEKIPNFRESAVKFNPAIRKIPAMMKPKLRDAHIQISGWGEFIDEVIVHAAKYGITNTTDKCAGRTIRNEDPTPCASPETHFYYHVNHPSAVVNKIVGDRMYEQWMAAK